MAVALGVAVAAGVAVVAGVAVAIAVAVGVGLGVPPRVVGGTSQSAKALPSNVAPGMLLKKVEL